MKTGLLLPLVLGGGVAVGVLSTLLLTRHSAKQVPDDIRPPAESRGSGSSERFRPALKTLASNSARPVTPSSAPFSQPVNLPKSSPAQAGAWNNGAATTASNRGGGNPSRALAPASGPSAGPVQIINGGNGGSGGTLSSASSSGANTTASSGSGSPPNGDGGGSSVSNAATSQDGTSTGNSSSSGTEEIILPVPAGSIAPAVFYDQEERTPQQQAALDKIGSEFNDNVSNSAEGATETENWEAARKIADQRYLTLFGFDAYNQYHIQAAKEALKEKKALATPAPTGP